MRHVLSDCKRFSVRRVCALPIHFIELREKRFHGHFPTTELRWEDGESSDNMGQGRLESISKCGMAWYGYIYT